MVNFLFSIVSYIKFNLYIVIYFHIKSTLIYRIYIMV